MVNLPVGRIENGKKVSDFASVLTRNRVANIFFGILFLVHSLGFESNNFRFLGFLQYYCASKD